MTRRVDQLVKDTCLEVEQQADQPVVGLEEQEDKADMDLERIEENKSQDASEDQAAVELSKPCTELHVAQQVIHYLAIFLSSFSYLAKSETLPAWEEGICSSVL